MKQRKRHIIVLGLVISIVTLLVGRSITWRMWDYLQALEKQVREQKAILAQAEEEITQNAAFVNKWNQIKGFQEEPVEDRKNNFSAYLNSLEALVFANIGPATSQPIEDREAFQILSYKVTFSANLEELVDFLIELDQSERLVQIDQLRITSKGLGTPRGSYSMTLPSSADLEVVFTVSIPAAQSPSVPLEEEIL